MKFLLSLVMSSITMSMSHAAFAAPQANLVGDWVLHIYLGQRVFDDELSVRSGADGVLGGTLSVPDRFTAPLQDVVVSGKNLSFVIVADEGRGPFKVRYAGEFHPSGDTFIGFATLPDEGDKLLGGFVSQRRVAK